MDLNPHSHASAARAVALVRAGEADLLMKGSLHTDELMHEVCAHGTGLRTSRRLSHVYLMDVPTYPRPLLITDAALNITPSLEDKRDIIQNAIDLAHIMGTELPRVAILSAVETIDPAIRSTLDAAVLCKMADLWLRQQSLLFVNKRSKKTLSIGDWPHRRRPPIDKSFLLLFFKKAASYSATNS